MMKVKYILCLFTLCLVFALSACSDPVAEELVDYLNNEMSQFSIMEEELEASYDNYERAAQAGDENLMYEIHQEQLKPQTEEIYELITSIEFEHEEVEQLNQLLIEEMSYKREALLVEEEGFELALLVDESHHDEAREKFDRRDELYEQANHKMVQFLERLEEMEDQYNIIYDENIEVED
jgi:hypothetical protein